MELITTPKRLNELFSNLIEKHNEIYWATAWASKDFLAFDKLVENKDKIRKMIVGIHFYQTHPEFINAFLDNDNVHFILQPDGTFHPKVYLFYNNDKEWELILGSANFTAGAFSKNTEASILISSSDSNAKEIYKSSKKLINNSFKEGITFNGSRLESYKSVWENQQRKINSLSGNYGGAIRKAVSINDIPIMNRNWDKFVKLVKNEEIDGRHSLDDRLEIIDFAQNLFKTKNSLRNMDEVERRLIAGLPEKGEDIDAGLFGSMKGAGVFYHEINVNNVGISNALDTIPLSGQITRSDYNNFISAFTNTFKKIDHHESVLSAATRLLSMKRPDVFVSFNGKNKSKLCKDFKIRQSNMDYNRYWNDIVERIFDSNWWLNPNIKNIEEQKIYEARAAFLDSIYYNPK